MEIMNKKLRCHGSIVLEECVKAIVGIVAFALVNLIELITEGLDMEADGLPVLIGATGVVLLILMIVLIVAVIRWRKTTITIDADSIVWERRTINRKTLTIGIKNISSINIERNLFERVIGTAKLKLDTSSLSTADTTDVLFVFKYEDALGYKQYLEEKVRENEKTPKETNLTETVTEDTETANTSEGIVYVSSLKEIVMHCIYDISLSVVLIGVLVTVASVIGVIDALQSEFRDVETLIMAGTFAVTFGYASFRALIGKLFQFYNLTVARQGNRLHMRYGMFKIREYVIPIEKINSIHIKQTLIGRLCKRYNVSMECVGVGDEDSENAQLTLSLPYGEVISRLEKLLPEYDVTRIDNLKKVSKKVCYHKCMRLLVFTVLVAGYAVGTKIVTEYLEVAEVDRLFRMISIGVIAFIYLYIIIGIVLQSCTEALGFGERQLFAVTGTYGKDLMIVSYKKVQYATIKKSPLSIWSGLSKGMVHILAGKVNTEKAIPYMTEEEVEVLAERIL